MKKTPSVPRLGWILLVPCITLLCAMHEATAARAADTPRRISVTAKRFAYEPAEITLKKGEPVVLALTSVDVAHGVKFDELGLKTDIGKGSTAELAFTPEKTGTFVGHCSHFCGSGHGSMTLTLHVTD